MKTLYQINKVMIIIWGVLMCTIYLGLLFMMPLGGIQILCSLYLISGKKWANDQIRNWLFIHLFLSVIALIGLGFSSMFNDLMIAVWILSGCLALFFTYITYKNYKDFETNSIDLNLQAQ